MLHYTAQLPYSFINSMPTFTLVFHFAVYNTSQTNDELFDQLLIIVHLLYV